MGETVEVPAVRSTDGLWKRFDRRRSDAMDDWEARKAKYAKWYSLIRADSDQLSTPYNATVRSKYLHAQIMTFTDFLLAGVIPSWPWVEVECPEPFRTDPMVAIESAAREEFNRRLKRLHWYRHLRRWIRTAANYGVGIAKLTGGPDGARVRIITPDRIAWDPTADMLREGCGYVIERVETLTVGRVKALGDSGVFNKLTRNMLRAIAQNPLGDTERQKRYAERINAVRDSSDDGDDLPVEIHLMVEPHRVSAFHWPTESVLQDKPNTLGFINYYDWSTYPEVDEVQGYAIPELIEDIQEEINTNLAQQIDNNSLISNAMALLSNAAGINPYTIQNRPGGVIPVNDVERDFKWLFPPPIGQALSYERGELYADGDRLLGVNQHTRGEMGDSGMKATVAQLLHSNTNVRQKVAMLDAQDYPLRAILNDLAKIEAMDPEPFWIPKEEWAVICPLVAQGHCELVPQAEAFVGNALAKIQVLANVLSIALPRLGPVGSGAMLEEIVKLADMRDPERVTRDLAMSMQMQQPPNPEMPPTNEGEATQVQSGQLRAQATTAGAPRQPARATV